MFFKAYLSVFQYIYLFCHTIVIIWFDNAYRKDYELRNYRKPENEDLNTKGCYARGWLTEYA